MRYQFRLALMPFLTFAVPAMPCQGEDRTEKESIAVLERLGARFMPNDEGEIISVTLVGPQVTDAHLRYVADIHTVVECNLFFTNTTGTGLTELRRLPLLKSLKLCGTSFTSRHIGNIIAFPKLEKLCISHIDSMQGASRILSSEQIASRRRLSLRDEDLIPLAKLLNLQTLQIDGMPITGKCMRPFSDRNRFQDQGPFDAKKRLQRLSLPNTAISDEGLKTISEIQSLRNLGLYKTQITDEGVEHLIKLGNLTKLELNGTRVTDKGARTLGALRNLRILNLDRRISNSTVEILQKALPWTTIKKHPYFDETLKPEEGEKVVSFRYTMAVGFLGVIGVQLDVEHGRVVWVDLGSLSEDASPPMDSTLQFVGDLHDVRSVGLAETRTTDAGIRHLRGLKKIEEIDLKGTLVTDEGLSVLSGLKTLETVLLDATSVTDKGVAKLTTLPLLRTMALYGCKNVTDKSLEPLSKLKKLEAIDLSYTGISPAGVERLRKALPKTRIVYKDE